MFELPEGKLFMDSVHGYISIPKCFVERLIDTEMFQRLRNIDQTGMRVLYPNAKHDRFSHSLGVYHLGRKAVDMLLENFSQEDYWKISSDSRAVTFWAKNKVLFLIACLLHDIGHAPFSHALEKMMLQNSRKVDTEGGQLREVKLPDRLAQELMRLEGNDEKIKKIDAAPHEIIGAMYIVTHLRDAVEGVFDDLIEKKYPAVASGDILYAEHYQYDPRIDKSELDRDLAFIARMILGLKYTGYQPEKQICNCFIELLNGGNFDVDKLDYVIRDTKMSGISNISIDLDRLLGAVCIVPKTRYVDRDFTNAELIDRTALELTGEDEQRGLRITGNFRGTILLKDHADVTIYKNSTFISFRPMEQSRIRYARLAEAAKFSTETVLVQDGESQKDLSESPEGKYKLLDKKNGSPFDFGISNARIVSREFHFTTETETKAPPKRKDVAALQVNGYCDILIKGGFAIRPSAKFFEAKITGPASDLVLLGGMLCQGLPDQNVYNEFSVGFRKQAVNVIANVLEARDYLYLWIYAHHKVMYYTNFLIPLVSREVLESAEPGGFPSWRLTYEDIEHLDDAYVWTAIRYCYAARKDAAPEWRSLCRQLLERSYRASLYKSLAEFDLLFEAIPIDKRPRIRDYLLNNFHKARFRLDDLGAAAGYLSDELVDELKKRGGGSLDQLADIVYVDAGYKMNRLKGEEAYIVTNEGTVASLEEIPLLAGRLTAAADTSYYFYLYYRTTAAGGEERGREAAVLKETIRNFFTEKFGNAVQ